MLLACDIGNSHISVGAFKDQTLEDHFSIVTEKKATVEDYSERFKAKIAGDLKIEKLIVASVVPDITKEVASAFEAIFGVTARVLSNDDIPVDNKYAKPETVGTDRLLNAYGAAQLHRPPFIIVDFGTATTFDVVSKNNEYLGGAIVPGVETSLSALYGKASKLQAVELKKPSEHIGHTTEESIRSGVVIGTAGLVDKMVDEIESELGTSTRIATGGLADLIIPYSEKVNIIEQHLTLKAMAKLVD